MEKEQLQQDLERIGLLEKEAKIYLASLHLGSATAQQIAARAVISRPSTYIMIESLLKKGLLSIVEKEKKRFFVASPPQHLLSLIDDVKKEILEKEELVKKISSTLSQLTKNVQTTAVRVYEGAPAVTTIQQDILSTDADIVYDVFSFDEIKNATSNVQMDRIAIARTKRKVKILSTSPAFFTEKQLEKNIEFRHLEREDASTVQGEVILYGTKVALLSYGKKSTSILIDDAKIHATIVAMFLSLWEKGQTKISPLKKKVRYASKSDR